MGEITSKRPQISPLSRKSGRKNKKLAGQAFAAKQQEATFPVLQHRGYRVQTRCRDCHRVRSVSSLEFGLAKGARCSSCGGMLDSITPLQARKSPKRKSEQRKSRVKPKLQSRPNPKNRQDKKLPATPIMMEATNSKKETLSQLYKLISSKRKWSSIVAIEIVGGADSKQLAHIVGAKRKDFESVDDSTWSRITECMNQANRKYYGRKPRSEKETSEKLQKSSLPQKNSPVRRSVSSVSERCIPGFKCQKCEKFLTDVCWCKSQSEADRVPGGNTKKICNACFSSLNKIERRGYQRFYYSQSSAKNVNSGQTRKK